MAIAPDGARDCTDERGRDGEESHYPLHNAPIGSAEVSNMWFLRLCSRSSCRTAWNIITTITLTLRNANTGTSFILSKHVAAKYRFPSKMKLNVLLVFSVLASLGSYCLMTRRKGEEERGDKVNRFQGIKIRVTADVLQEYRDELLKVGPRLEKVQAEVQAIEAEVAALLSQETEKKAQRDDCDNGKKKITDELASVEGELRSNTEEFTKQKTSWEAEVASLKKQKDEQSKLCDFIKKDVEMARKLCGMEPLKPEEAKAEAPKPEEAKAEAPKPEEAKAEAPKPEEAKAEAPKPEEAKAEAPKPEEARAEAPKA
ncbi:hypothetical protein N1851_012455 [Merluccius polli]|uniref:Uncharacterized protein n=1 Tax=Merluccius polli TaxID=89951 RepID=A0AA47P291_MERPO|nr:hypothetical protein N1851_012455 [Merluccius polli]